MYELLLLLLLEFLREYPPRSFMNPMADMRYDLLPPKQYVTSWHCLSRMALDMPLDSA